MKNSKVSQAYHMINDSSTSNDILGWDQSVLRKSIHKKEPLSNGSTIPPVMPIWLGRCHRHSDLGHHDISERKESHVRCQHHFLYLLTQTKKKKSIKASHSLFFFYIGFSIGSRHLSSSPLGTSFSALTGSYFCHYRKKEITLLIIIPLD